MQIVSGMRAPRPRAGTGFRATGHILFVSAVSVAVLVRMAAGQDASQLLDRGRRAIAPKAAGRQAVDSLIIKGTVSSTAAGSTAAGSVPPRDLEIRILLPSHYLRIERGPRSVRRAGFSGDRLLNGVEVAGAKMNLKNGGTGLQLKEERQELQRWLLGMLCLIARSAGREERDGSFTPCCGAELTLSFEQRRLLDGFSLPYHVKRLAGDVVLEDIRISSIELNPGLNVSDFEPR